MIKPEKLDDTYLLHVDEDLSMDLLAHEATGYALSPTQNAVLKLYAHILYQNEEIARLKGVPRRHNLDTLWNPEP